MGLPFPWDIVFAPEAKMLPQGIKLDPFSSLRDSFMQGNVKLIRRVSFDHLHNGIPGGSERLCSKGGQLSGHIQQSAFREEGNRIERTNQSLREGRQNYSYSARKFFTNITKAHKYTGN